MTFRTGPVASEYDIDEQSDLVVEAGGGGYGNGALKLVSKIWSPKTGVPVNLIMIFPPPVATVFGAPRNGGLRKERRRQTVERLKGERWLLVFLLTQSSVFSCCCGGLSLDGPAGSSGTFGIFYSPYF